MAGIGLLVSYLGYAVVYWALESIQGNAQPSFSNYLFPFTKKNTSKDNLAKVIQFPGNGGPPGTQGPTQTKSTTPTKHPPSGYAQGSGANLH